MTSDYSPAEIIHVLVKDEVIRSIQMDQGDAGRPHDPPSQVLQPQFAIKRFQDDIKQMEEAVSQFHRIGNRTELGAGRREGGGNGGSGGGPHG